jgi:hypothetical protein
MSTRSNAVISVHKTNLPPILLSAFVAIIIFSSCQKEPTAPYHYYPEPSEYRHSTFPLAVGNQWAYTDSNYTLPSHSNAFARIRLSSIASYTQVNNQAVWMFTDINGKPDISYSIANDTIYVDDSPTNGALLNPRIAYLPASAIQDTVRITGPYSWTVTKIYPLRHSLTTPAGTFDSVYVYELDLNVTTLTFYRPSIGVICQESYPPDRSSVQRSELTSFVLAN